MTAPNAAHVRHTAVQVDTELYLPAAAQLLVDTQVVSLAELALQAGQTATAAEVNKLAGVTGGTVTLSKAVVVDANKDIGNFRNVRATRLIRGEGAATSDATVGNRTYTAAEILGGIIVRDCAGGSRSDVFPTAAALVAAIPGCAIGDIIEVLIINGSDPVSEIITLTAGSGGGFDANQTAVSRTILGTCSKLVRVRITNITGSSEAYVIYS